MIDHLEAPSLTLRHPLNVAQLLWRVRAVTQLQPRLRAFAIALKESGRSSGASTATGRAVS